MKLIPSYSRQRKQLFPCRPSMRRILLFVTMRSQLTLFLKLILPKIYMFVQVFSCFPPKVPRRYTIPLSCNAQPGNFFRTTAQIHFFREIMASLKYCIISMLTLKELLLNRYQTQNLSFFRWLFSIEEQVAKHIFFKLFEFVQGRFSLFVLCLLQYYLFSRVISEQCCVAEKKDKFPQKILVFKQY